MSDTVAAAVRLGLYLDLMLLFGLPLFGLYTLRGTERAASSILPFRPVLFTTAIAGIALSAFAMVVLAASMAGVGLGEVDRATIAAVASGTSIGTAWQVRLAALLASAVCAVACWRHPGIALRVLAILGAIALGTLAWTGHGAADEGVAGWVHLGADILHLWAAGVWLGALAALAILLFAPAARQTPDLINVSHRALHGFAKMGSVAVAVLIASGLVNSWMLVGPANLGALFTTLYGQLLVVKLLIFALMLLLAGANRFFLTPALASGLAAGDTVPALRALRRSLASESVCGLVVLGLVAWLGLLAPPASGM